MNNNFKKVERFLKKYNLHHSLINIDHYSNLFIKEMKKGLLQKRSSLKMLPTFINTKEKIQSGQKIIVIDAGGTNLRIALVEFNKSFIPDVTYLKNFKMPGYKKEISSHDFFKMLKYYLKPIENLSGKIGFCFSYPTESNSDKDGKVISFSKEISINGLKGNYLGNTLNSYFKHKKKIIVLNDTVAALLSGLIYKEKKYDSYIGFILGTGTNCGYIGDYYNVKNRINYTQQVINIESGNFNKIKRGMIDIELDNNTDNPNSYTLEKMISGQYLGSLINSALKYAVHQNLFDKNSGYKLLKIDNISTKELSDFLDNPFSSENILSASLDKKDDDNRVTLFLLIDNFIERAAKISAFILSAVSIYLNKGKNPIKPICFVCEGTTFNKLNNLKFKTNFYLKNYLEHNKKIFFDIININNATLIGSAVAALIN
ncbi:MAG: hexokinase [Spirochaetes bacterium]|nr:hexokinase [Spirochaetota bacterium]